MARDDCQRPHHADHLAAMDRLRQLSLLFGQSPCQPIPTIAQAGAFALGRGEFPR